MVEYFALLTGDLTIFILLVFILVIISIILSIISLALMRRATAGGRAAPQMVITPIEERVSKPPTPPRAEGKAAKPPPGERRVRGATEIVPAVSEELIGFASLEELASMIGAKSLILFNQSGIPIESHNVTDEDRLAASLADFVSIMRKFNPNFDSMISEDDRRAILLSIGTIGDTEVFALAVGESEIGLELEEVRGFLKTYLSESLGRYR